MPVSSEARKWITAGLVGVPVIFAISLYIARRIVIGGLPWNVCLSLAGADVLIFLIMFAANAAISLRRK